MDDGGKKAAVDLFTELEAMYQSAHGYAVGVDRATHAAAAMFPAVWDALTKPQMIVTNVQKYITKQFENPDDPALD